MPELTTEQVTTHTLTLTDDELASLREAATTALSDSSASVHTRHWQAFARLGIGPTRSRRAAVLTDTYANADLIGKPGRADR
ncbi:hypothetical protein [Streptomyces sp. NPDC093109]|uniref:hypothetical protein n=1 Tax=Streptomyces sp. NPDC093109 TaxID=3154977 RepID=UPI00344DD779